MLWLCLEPKVNFYITQQSSAITKESNYASNIIAGTYTVLSECWDIKM